MKLVKLTNVFTQVFTINNHSNGERYYFSSGQERIWWSESKNSWNMQADISKTGFIRINPRCLDESNNDDIKAICFQHKNKCLGKNEGNVTIQLLNENSSTVLTPTIKAPCKFPFKYDNKTFNECTKYDATGFWCVLNVFDSDLDWTSWGYCNEFCSTEDHDSQSWPIIVSTLSISFLLIVSAIVIIHQYHKKKKRENLAMINSNMILNEDLSYNGKYEIDRSKFEIGRKLGGGSFGSVHEGTTEDPVQPGQNIKVAIKTVNNPLDQSQVYALMCEIKVLEKLDKHLNLVNMIGACTT